MMKHVRRIPFRAITALAAAGVLIVALHGLSRLGLRGPAGGSREEVEAWLEDPITAVATMLRWVALVMTYYLAAILVVIVVTENRLDDSPMRHVIPSRLATALGLFIGVGAVVVPLAGHMTRTASPMESAATEQLHLTKLDDTLALERVDPEPGRRQRPVPESSSPRAGAKTTQVEVDTSWTVAPGDSFWRIADEHLRDVWEREVTDSEVATYWTILIEANAERLVEPNNPDLLFPGQVLSLPEVPPVTR